MRPYELSPIGILVLLVALLSGPAPLPAQSESPVIRPFGVMSGASFASAERGPGLAPGSIFLIWGDRLGPEELVQAALPFPTQLPAEPGGSHVEFRSIETGETFEAFLIHSSRFQVAGIVPSQMSAGRYEAIVEYQQRQSEPQPFRVVARAPAVFTVSMQGFGPGVVQVFESPQSTPLNQLTRPARPGDYLVIWATGLGAIEGADNIAPPVGDLGGEVHVEIGGRRVRASYAGRAPGFPGVDQINVALPLDGAITTGCYVPLRVLAGEAASNTVTVSVSEEPGTCRHPMNFSTQTLAHLDASGTVALGNLNMGRFLSELSTPLFPSDPREFGFAGAFFVEADAVAVALMNGPGREQPMTGCEPAGLTGAFIETDAFVPARPVAQHFWPLDAGEFLTLTGPSGQTLQLDRREDPAGQFGSYGSPDDVPGDFFEPGVWSFESIGNAAVGSFVVETMLPRQLRLDLPEVVRRDEPLTLTWPIDGYDESQIASVGLAVSFTVQDGPFGSTTGSVGVGCRGRALAGSLTLPQTLLEQLPEPDRNSGWISFGVTPSAPTTFTAPGLAYGSLIATVGGIRSVSVE